MASRARKRIPVQLDGEIFSDKGKCIAIINNISEKGLYAIIPARETDVNYPFNSDNYYLKLQLPSGKPVNLNCNKRWSYHVRPGSLINHVGLEVINPPYTYKKYYHHLIFRYFKWE